MDGGVVGGALGGAEGGAEGGVDPSATNGAQDKMVEEFFEVRI